MVFSILLFMNLQNGIYAISTVSDSLVVQIEDLQSPDVEIFSDLSTLCELMTSFNGNYVPRAGMTSQLPFIRLIKYTICISRYCVVLTTLQLVKKELFWSKILVTYMYIDVRRNSYKCKICSRSKSVVNLWIRPPSNIQIIIFFRQAKKINFFKYLKSHFEKKLIKSDYFKISFLEGIVHISNHFVYFLPTLSMMVTSPLCMRQHKMLGK